jgi:hypothetical protein
LWSGIEFFWPVKEESHARITIRGPARPNLRRVSLPLERLWKTLAADEQQQILRGFSQMIARQLPAPAAAKEVGHEDC